MPKLLVGTVVSTKMNKTVVVQVERIFAHPLYKKTVRRHKKYKAHNEIPDLVVGDKVEIQETRPISKDKHFVVKNKK
ncbi:30S ribosomal protein S17 [Candidatus Roizmanbacteria bacterium RIFCSPLOWO2_02_FULL_38_10]|uniref:Small ribosomal subunit protein uS17 n=1 Tax=Candidatus Roizmanbacteria bacterium RIFCSPLOWO2_02_FULL_38_10 TaxID=1802074 RepID=A0A1F7JKA1_9BACT|nr:MAG: 30S ribosomal protein S17 [Candidatus Roizmanbacteria bacterium RIFCSPLOWO2_02_FULL_38_10]